MKDRFTLGFIAGIIGAIPMNAMDLYNFYLSHLAKIRYLDFSGYMIFGRLPRTAGEAIMSQIVQLGFSGILGVFFVKILKWTGLKNSWFKGVLWGNGIWFVLYSLTVLYKIPVISTPDFGTALTHYISTAVYGIVMALTFVWLDEKAETGAGRDTK